LKRIASLREKSNTQLKQRLEEIGMSLIRVRGFNRAGKSYYHPMFARKLKKEKARILTILSERGNKNAQ
jgi:ribosomal protein L29